MSPPSTINKNKNTTGLSTLGPGSIFGAGQLFSCANASAIREKKFNRHDVSLIAGSKGAVIVEINQVHVFALLSSETLQQLAHDASISYYWRQHRLQNFIVSIEDRNADNIEGANQWMKWKEPLRMNPTVPFGRLLMSQLVRPHVGTSRGVPCKLKIPGVIRSIHNHNTSTNKDMEKKKITKDNGPEERQLQINTARLGREKDKVPQIPRIPRVSGGRVANARTLKTLARDVWHIQVLQPSPHSTTETNDQDLMKTFQKTILLPRESAMQQPAFRPKLGHQSQTTSNKNINSSSSSSSNGNLSNMQFLPQRPMTKRQNYQYVQWHGPRVAVAKKWSIELRPKTRGYKKSDYVQPPPPLLTTAACLAMATAPPVTSSAPSHSHNREEDNDSGGEDDVVFLNAGRWPAQTFSRAGKQDRRSRNLKRRRQRKQRKAKKRLTISKSLMPSISKNVGGTLIHIGSTFLPSISKRMR
jgi:hypothetical protein